MKRVGIFLIVIALLVGMVGCASESYGLVITSTEGGSVTAPGEGIFIYDEGTVVNLTAEAVGGYHFIKWTGDVSTVADVAAAATTITVNDSYSITANFEAIPQYDLTIAGTTGGNVTTPGEGTSAYAEGTMVNLVATPDSCYSFVDWTGNVGTIANVNAASTTITMNGDYFITANFAQYTPMVTAGQEHTVGLKSDGTLVAVGYNLYGQCDVGGWNLN